MKNKDDIIFGSIVTIIGAIIAGVVCFFGNANQLVWLAAFGAIIAVVFVFISLLLGKVGIVASMLTAIVVILGRNWFSNMDNDVFKWLYANEGTIDIFFFARIGVLICMVLIISVLICFNENTNQ